MFRLDPHPATSRRQARLEYCLIHSSLAILPSWIRRAPDLTGHQIGGFLFSFLTTPAAVVVLSVRHDGVMFRPSWNFFRALKRCLDGGGLPSEGYLHPFRVTNSAHLKKG